MKLRDRIGSMIGYECLRITKHPSLGTHLQVLLQQHAIDLVIDVGANHGQFARLIRERGYRGHIWSFEPVAASFKILETAAASDPRWEVFQLALGDIAGVEHINVTGASVMSSFLSGNEFGEQHFSDGIRTLQREEVRVETLDGFLDSHAPGREARIFLKMDTQGFDLRVFEGARAALGRVRAMLSEISLTPLYDGMPHYLEALRRYEDAGFVASGLYPVSRNSDLSLLEIDCVMINRRCVS